MRSLSLLATLLFLTSLVNAEISGKIESCSGWALNKLPQLKSFLKDGEAEEYQNVEVTFIPGRKAVLTIYESGKEREKVTLSDISTKPEMHKLMVDKGFERKSEDEIRALKAVVESRKKQENNKLEAARENAKRMMENRKKTMEERNGKLASIAAREAVQVRTKGQEIKMLMDGGAENTPEQTEPAGLIFLSLFSAATIVGLAFFTRRRSKGATHSK